MTLRNMVLFLPNLSHMYPVKSIREVDSSPDAVKRKPTSGIEAPRLWT